MCRSLRQRRLSDLRQLDMLILQVLSLEAAHGYGIAQRLQQISRETVQVNQGSVKASWDRLTGAVQLIFSEGE